MGDVAGAEAKPWRVLGVVSMEKGRRKWAPVATGRGQAAARPHSGLTSTAAGRERRMGRRPIRRKKRKKKKEKGKWIFQGLSIACAQF